MSVKLNRNLIHGFKYSSEYIYSKNDIVIESTDDDVLMYKSLIDNNLDSDIHDPTKWECSSLLTHHFSMFVPVWSDHKMNEIAFLRADTYSWHDSRIYQSAYEWLLDEVKDRNTNNLSVYTSGNIKVTYYQSPNGLRIASEDQEDEIEDLYRQDKVAWFYIIDTKKKRFKLPRTEYGFVGKRDNIGNIVNIATSGSNLKATEMYLYFCVGGVAKNKHVIDVGKVMEIINDFDLTLYQEKINIIKDNGVNDINNKVNEGLETLSQATLTGYNTVSGSVGSVVESVIKEGGNQINLIKSEKDNSIQQIITKTNESLETIDQSSDNTIATIESMIDEVQSNIDSLDIENIVNKTSNQEIDGIKTFIQIPRISSTIKIDDNSNNIVTSNWVNSFFNNQRVINSIVKTSGNINLEENKLYTMSINGNTTFVLPIPSNTNIFNQIKIMIRVIGTPTIDWGTTYFFNKETPSIEESSYDVYFDYDNLLGNWVCGYISKGST